MLEELDKFCEYYDLDFNSNDIEVQININSPGKVDYKSRIKKATLTLGIIQLVLGGGYEDRAGNKFKTDGIPGLIKTVITAVMDYQTHQQDLNMRAKVFNRYYDSLKVRNPEEFNKLMKQYSPNKDLPK